MQGVWEIYGKITDSYTNEMIAGAAAYQAGAALKSIVAGTPAQIADDLMSPTMYLAGGISYVLTRGLINLLYGPTIAPALVLVASTGYGANVAWSFYNGTSGSGILIK